MVLSVGVAVFGRLVTVGRKCSWAWGVVSVRLVVVWWGSVVCKRIGGCENMAACNSLNQQESAKLFVSFGGRSCDFCRNRYESGVMTSVHVEFI